MSFVNGANGLVDFYSDLVDIIYDHSTPYHPSLSSLSLSSSLSSTTTTTTTMTSHQSQHSILQNESSLNDAIIKHFNGSDSYPIIDQQNHHNHHIESNDNNETFAYAIPTFQPSQRFLKRHNFTITQDVDVIRNIILCAKKYYPTSSLYISSAYLNPTPLLMSAIEQFITRSKDESSLAFFLSAAPKSHGFKPKKKDTVNGSGRGWIPSVFMKMAEDVHLKLSLNGGGKVLLYEREGYTFHAKGLWLTSSSSSSSPCDDNSINDDSNSLYHSAKKTDEKEIVQPENNLLVSVVGSSNYGSRSEILDFESNCILVMNPMADSTKAKEAKVAIANDWNSMLEYHVEYGSREGLGVDDHSSSTVKAFALGVVKQLVRRFF